MKHKRLYNQSRRKITLASAHELISSRFIVIFLLALGVVTSTSAAGLKLASYFGDHMVLQRNESICIWGTGEPQAQVEVKLAAQKIMVTVGDDQQWKAYLKPVTAGGPYILTLTSGGDTITVNDVLCGDVWLCSGQSNMQMPVKECVQPERDMADNSHPKLRLCTVAKGWKDTPQTSAEIHWRDCSPETARNFSAVGYFFADELLKDSALKNVPIGVIDSSFGGTTCEGWIPRPALADFKSDDLHNSMFGIKPSDLYNAMIAPLGLAGFKGVVWYQGESNSGHPEMYAQLLSTMIKEWRAQFNDSKLSFFIVQLPDYASQWDGFYWPWEREAQAKTVQSTPDTTLVVGIETTDGFNLHPKNKMEIGRRVALAVRQNVYHEHIAGSGPVFISAKVEGPAMRVNLNPCDGGLACSSPDGIRGFAVAGADGIYHFANATIESNQVVVSSAAVPQPKTVRYAWTGVPESTLINSVGLPAAPFRTDNFPPANIEVQKESVGHQVTTSAYKIVINGEGMIASLSVGGAQFISNDPGMAGGSSIPGPFGPIALPHDQEIGPDLFACSDGNFTFQTRFLEKGLDWTFTNQGKDEVKFNIALASSVSISEDKNAGTTTLRCRNAMITVTGIDSVSDSDAGKQLKVIVKGGATKNIMVQIH